MQNAFAAPSAQTSDDVAVLDDIASTVSCLECGSTFTPRGPGKPQRFCAPTCRHAFNNRKRINAHNAFAVDENNDAQPETPAPADERAGGLVYFDWSDPKLTKLPEQRQTAIYIDNDGDLVIRQRVWNHSEDPMVIIASSTIDTFLDRITEVCGVPSVP